MICARTQCILIVSWYAGLVAWRCGPYTNASGSQSIAAVYSVRGDPSRDIVLPMLVKLDKCTPRLPGQSKGVIARRDGRSPVAEGCRCPTLSSFVTCPFGRTSMCYRPMHQYRVVTSSSPSSRTAFLAMNLLQYCCTTSRMTQFPGLPSLPSPGLDSQPFEMITAFSESAECGLYNCHNAAGVVVT
jgi:hypothetical protein